jgi:hypothetical protein
MNMMRVLVTLITYEDWVWSHPNPQLVANYMLRGTRAYASELRDVSNLVRRGWHADPSPSEIDWIRVVTAPRQTRLYGRLIPTPATLDVLINQKVGQYLNRQGRVVGHSPGGGKAAFSVTLEQGSGKQWRIADVSQLNLSGGLEELSR